MRANRSARQTEAREAISAALAEQERVTYETQRQAQTVRQELEQATVLRTVVDAQAARTKAVGAAEAAVIRLKINSMEAGNYAVVQLADALTKSGAKLVPDIVAGGGSGRGGSLVDVLLAGLIREGMAAKAVK